MFEGYRLSPQQRQLWQLEQASQYAQMIISITGLQDKTRLLRAIQEVIARHEILRTDFQFTTGIALPVQVVKDEGSITVSEHDLQSLDKQEQQVKIVACCEQAIVAVSQARVRAGMQIALLSKSRQDAVMILTFPALYADSATLTLVVKDIVAAYTSQLDGSELPEVDMQYADIAQWLNDMASGEEAEEDEAVTYPEYLEHLEQLMAQRLPSSLACEQPSSAHAVQTDVLPEELLAGLLRLSEQYTLSLEHILLSCWQLLLWRATNKAECAIGVACDGRNYAELEEAPGPLSIVVPFFSDLSEDRRWDIQVSQLQQQIHDLYERQEDFLWEKLARQYPVQSTAPRFAFGFEYIQTPEVYTAGQTIFAVEQLRSQTGQCELKLTGLQSAKGLALTLDYAPALHGSSTVSRLLAQLIALLTSIAQAPESPIGQLSMLSHAEQDLLLTEINQTAVAFQPACLHQLFEAQARRTPQTIAVVDEQQQVTYAELDARANAFAYYLQIRGVGPEVPVALWLGRSVEMLIAMLGILKAGGAYVALDPDMTRAQVGTLLQDAQLPVLLMDSSAAALIDQPGVLVLDRQQMSLNEGKPVPALVRQVTPAHMVYLLFTSGSTGKPKGVVIEHRQICNYIQGCIQRFEIEPGSTFATVSTFAADLGNTTLYTSLCTGGTLHIISPERAIDPEQLAAYFRQSPPDYLKIVPSHLVALLSGTQPELIMPAKKLFLGGETLHWQLVERLQQLKPACTIINHYGPTETTVGTLAAQITGRPVQGESCPIGTPLTNTQVYLLDQDLRLVPTLVPGEIYVGGQGVARGYHLQPEQTAERFIPAPFNTQPGARLYRTGDHGRYLPDGSIEFLGRHDAQVKIRGFRVELGGIEQQLRQHPDVQDAIVLAGGDSPEHKQLTAYIVPTETARASYQGRERYLLPNNLALLQLNKHETDFFYQQIFEENTEFRHGISLPEDAVVVDVGANIGLFTLFVRQFYPQARVYAFEPIPPTFEVLQLNARLYAGSDERIKLFSIGLSDSAREETFTYYPQSSCQSGYYADVDEDMQTLRAIMLKQEHEAVQTYIDTVVAERSESQQFVCQLKLLSEIISECAIEHIDLLKIDVEKSELDILRGIADADWQKIDQIVMEAHDIGDHLSQIFSLLEQHGYTVAKEQSTSIQDTMLYNIYARRVSVQPHQPPHVPAQLPFPYLTEEGVAAFLAQRLPHYMLPSSYLLLERFPLMANGKVDRRALPHLQQSSSVAKVAFAPAETEKEKALQEIWQAVLGCEEVGIHANFFSLGGDSIQAILVVGHASKVGLHLTTKQIFQYPTIAELAQVVDSAPQIQAQQGLVVGEVRLTPIQHWFFENVPFERQHWNQAVLLRPLQWLQPQKVAQALRSLVMQHDMLRARFFQHEAGWRQEIQAEVPHSLLQTFDLTHLDAASQAKQLRSIATELQTSLHLEEGRLVQAALFDLGSEQRLFIVIHHLVVDGVSWRILLEDLHYAYEQAQQQQEIQLLPKTTSFQQWAESLTERAPAPDLQEQQRYWLEQIPASLVALPLDDPEGSNTVASEQVASLSLTEEETTFLLQQVPEVFNTQINDVLLAALGQAFSSWLDEESRHLLIDLEGHGRETMQEQIDVSRTVGWFTSLFPVVLDFEHLRGSEETLKYTKEQLRAIPQQGLGYGVLRYLNSRTGPQLAALPRAQVRFNYLGQIDPSGASSAFVLVDGEDPGPLHSPVCPRNYLFDIVGRISAGKLHVNWLYSSNVHAPETVEHLVALYAQALRTLLDYCRNPAAGGYTPSDFPQSRLSQDDLDDLLAQLSDN